jgi:plasmid stability protein
LSEREKGKEFRGIQNHKENCHRSNERHFREILRQRVDKEWRPASIRERARETGHNTPK